MSTGDQVRVSREQVEATAGEHQEAIQRFREGMGKSGPVNSSVAYEALDDMQRLAQALQQQTAKLRGDVDTFFEEQSHAFDNIRW